jgi:3-oxoacyl-[acyl-carrier protein] reductase
MTSTPILAGKRALVTGGSRGIGAAIVRRLASQGATVAVNYRSDRAAADALVGELTDQPCEARLIENYAATGNPGRTCPLFQGG